MMGMEIETVGTVRAGSEEFPLAGQAVVGAVAGMETEADMEETAVARPGMAWRVG